LAPKPANPEVVEGDLAAKPPNPPEMLPTGAGFAGAPKADAAGFPNADDPKPVEPNPDAEAVGVVETGLENAFGVPVVVVGLAGVADGVVVGWPNLEEVPNAVAGLMNELEVAVEEGVLVKAGFGVEVSSSERSAVLEAPSTGESGGDVELGS
jgi:hypothetical protein